MLWALICRLHFCVCYYHVAYVFQSESTLCSCLNIKKLLGRNRYDIWSLSDSNGTQTHNHLVCKRTLNRVAILAPVSSKEFLDIQTTIESGFTLKCARDMKITYRLCSTFPNVDFEHVIALQVLLIFIKKSSGVSYTHNKQSYSLTGLHCFELNNGVVSRQYCFQCDIT